MSTIYIEITNIAIIFIRLQWIDEHVSEFHINMWSYGCPSSSEASLRHMGKLITWIYKEMTRKSQK